MTAKGVILFTAAVGALLLCSCAKNEDTSSLTESQQEQSDFSKMYRRRVEMPRNAP